MRSRSERCKVERVPSEVIGREQELAELTSHLAAVGELPTVFLLEGEPGIGKTILWRAGLELALSHRYRALRATPASAETRLSFAALGDLLEPVLAYRVGRLHPRTRPAEGDAETGEARVSRLLE